MSKRILTPRALNAHKTKAFQKRKEHWHAQSDLASVIAATLASPNTPDHVRSFLQQAMRRWAEVTDAVNTPELARDAFIAMNLYAKFQKDFKNTPATETECRAFHARLAVVEIAIEIRNADAEGRAPSIPAAAIECLNSAIEELPGEEEAPEVVKPHITPVVDLLCWRQSHPRPIKHCVVEVKGGK
jgi:hypothetical protein